jgi:cytidylate kinase
VMEGRDIGTVILPEADLKLFLTANESIRNLRRIQDGETDQIAVRDRLDSSRKIAPLTESTDSIVLDTSVLSIKDVLSRVSQLIHNL